MAKKWRTVGDYSVRYGKNPGDDESDRAWRVFDENDDVHEESDEYESEDDAVVQAEELWNAHQCGELVEEITSQLDGFDDLETLQAIAKLVGLEGGA